MKKAYTYLAFTLLSILFSANIFAQCPNDNTLWIDLTPASCPGSASTSCIFGGEYCTVSVTSGNTYTFQTCGSTGFDTEISLYNQGTGLSIAYNDNGCGSQSTITWVATFTGVVRVLVDQYPCSSVSTCMTLSVTCSSGAAGIYTHPITGLQGTYLGACMVNTCSATYYDDGGAGGNYSNNVNNIYRTFCPSQPGTCIRATVTSMDIEEAPGVNCYDYLRILNGPTQNSPDLWAGCRNLVTQNTLLGTWTNPFTSTDASGCIGFRFYSDNTVARSGWAITLACTPCAGGPTATEDNNCSAAASVCGTTAVTGASTGPGLTSECNGCVVSENFTNWYKITVASNGVLALTINPNNNAEDYDFALYGPNVTCGALGTPIRCSYAAITANGSTGMGNGAVDFSETVTGDGWVSTLNVTAGQSFYLMINGWSAVSGGFSIDWTGSTTTFGVPPGSVTVQTNSSCAGLNQGSACAVVNAGVPPYIYNWGGGITTQCNNNVLPGTYTVTVTDASLCTSIASGTVASIPIPAAPTASGTTICQGNTATLTATAPGGTYQWYNAASGGTLLITNASYTTPALAATTTYWVQTTVGGCTSPRTAVTVTVTPTPSATISYAGNPFCKSVVGAQPVTRTGTAGGTFTAAPAGLTIDGVTGAVTPSTSTAGTYTVTYTVAASGGCPVYTTTTSVTITTLPVATFSYTGTPYCKNAANPLPTFSGGGVAGTFSSTGGLVFVSTATGQVNLAASTAGTYTVTNTIAAAGGCPIVTATSTITITTLPTASLSYAGTPFCTSVATAQPVTLVGTAGGTYSAAPAGLSINAGTGAITPSLSSAGTYTVTYTIPAAGGCGVVTATTSVTITTLPTATISYAGSPFCKTLATAQAVTLTGTSGGTYSAAPAGLSINAGTGAITPSTSTAGIYTVTYTIAAAGGCGVVTTTTSVTITNLPVATFSYSGTPYCSNAANPSPTYSGGGVAGTFSSTAGLVFVSTATGQVNLSASTPGTYTVTNTIAASGGCAVVTATSTITITALPSATISYSGSPYCNSLVAAQPVTLTGTSGGTYTAAPAGLTINAGTGAITPSSSTAGTYTVTYTVAAAGGCALFSTTTTVTITTLPVATFSYTGTPYCSNAANPLPTFSGGGVAGTFSSTAGLNFVSTATGQVNIGTSTAGSYTVTNTIAAANGCPIVTATSPITITTLPAATISYPGSPFCKSLTTAQPVTLTGTSGGTYSASPAGLTINAATGAVTPSTSTAGTYTVTYTIAASGGCGIVTTTTSVTITTLPTATISYVGTPFCTSNSTAQSVTLSGTAGGTYSAAPAGLSINAGTGAITPSTSAPGTYTVTYTIAAANGCGVVTATTSVTITALPVATFSYTGTPYCSNAANPLPTFSGGGVAGIFSSTAGLVFVSTATGQVNLSASTAGTYTVTNTIAAAGGCALVSSSNTITITTLPAATISYAGTPFCTSTSTSQLVTLTGTTGGTFSAAPAGLSINAGTGAITPSTSTAGTYTVTYTIAAANGCGVVTATTSVTVNPSPVIVSVNKTDVTICAGSDGTITINATGFAPLMYSINGGSTFQSNGGIYTGLTNGSYTIAVRNGYGCVTMGSTITISDGGAPSAPVAGTNATYCSGSALANLTATASSGGTLTWYSNPGLTAVLGTGTTLAPSNTIGVTNYYVTETVAGCQSAASTVTITITALPTATISYAGTPFCKTVATPQSVTLTGTSGGTYSAPAGLTINAGTGAITPSTSTAGTYTVTYTIPAAGGCGVVTATTSVTITNLPVATFSYSGTPYCSNGVNPLPTYSGGGVAGTFSSTAGLVFISTATGQVNLSASTPGTYTVTNTIAAAGGCAVVSANTTITITALPTASISYAGTPFCTSNSTPQSVTQIGTAGGTYTSAPAGLTINAATGAITPSTSTAGTYTVTYTIAAANGCGVVSTTTSVTITTLPVATISYAGTPFCTSVATGQPVTLTGTSGGSYSAAPAGLNINAGTGAINPSLSSAGTYTVTYTIPAANGCGVVTATTSVTITLLPTATISYSGTPFCTSNSTPQAVTLTGTSGGTYSAPAGLTINAGTGAITPSTSTPGSYTVTYTIPAASGCGVVTATAPVTITVLPTATISYAGTPFCTSVSTSQSVTLGGTLGGVYSAAPAGLNINAGTGAINPSLSVAGTYTVTYTIAAANGCGVVTATTSVTITTLPTASISYSGTPFCNSNSTPQAVTLTGTTGGTYSAPAGLTINAGTGAITPSTSTPGSYTVTYTILDASGCGVVTATASVTITTLPTATISYAGTPYCTSLVTSQSVTLTGTSGGTYSALPAGLSISAATGAITPSTSAAGTYTVTYTIPAANGCGIVTTTTTLTITTLPIATFSYTGSPYCSNAANPFPTFSGGGVAGTFSSTPGLVFVNTATGQINLAASTPGTYIVTNTIPAADGCGIVAATSSITITTLPVATITYVGTPFCTSNSTPQPVTLTGTSGGTYSAIPVGLTINPTTGAITPSTSTAGAYTITYTIAAANGCGVVTTTTTIAVTTLPSATISYAGTPYCNSNAVSQSVTLTGTPGGTYSASPAGLSLNPINGAIVPSSSIPGVYTVTYTIAAANGCGVVTTTASVTITSLPSATISYSNSPFCNSVASGSVTLNGTTGGLFSASPAGLTINPSDGTITPNTSTAGNYTVTYTIAAANGCGVVTTTAPVIINELPTASSSTSGILCNGGFTNVIVAGSGGTSPYTGTGTFIEYVGTYSYTISDANGCTASTSIILTEPAILVASATASAIPCYGGTSTVTVTETGGTAPFTGDGSFTQVAGSYTYTVTDANGCAASTSITITEPTPVSATVSTTFAGCSLSDGTATVNAAGGTGAYTYLWSPVGGTGATATGLAAGNYTVVTQDANGCSVSNNVSISNSGAPVVTYSSVDILCNGLNTGSIDLNVSGGTGGYTYSWNSGTYVTEDLSGITAGVYSYDITDGANCHTTGSITINEPTLLIANSSATNILCHGDTSIVTVSAIGGTGVVTGIGTFNEIAGNYSYIVTDANGCTASTSITISEPDSLIAFSTPSSILCHGDTSQVTISGTGGTPPYLGAGIKNVTAGTYTYNIIDANGCIAYTTFTIIEPDSLIASASFTPILCHGDSSIVIVSGTGGSGNYTGSGTFTLPAGTYTYTIVDDNSCSASVTLTISEPDSLITTYTSENILCNGFNNGTIDLTVSGGLTPYTFDWNNGAYSVEDLNNLPGGTYNFIVTDSASCQSTGTVIINEPSLLISSILEPTSPKCSYSSDGQAIVVVSGGTVPYNFLWSDVLNTTNDTISTLAGNAEYYVTVSDANGCSNIDTVYISAPLPVTVIGNITNALCNGNNGMISVVASGGTSPYSYLWDDPSSSTNDTISNLATGTYNVTVYDASACTVTYTASIVNVAGGVVQINQLTNVLCYGDSTGSISVSMQGGTSPFTYYWDIPGQTTSTANNLLAGIYHVTVVDVNSCSADTTILVGQPSTGILPNIIAQNASCFGGNNGTLSANVSGGTPPYQYAWDNGMIVSSIINLSSSIHTVTITDNNGCSVIANGTVTEPTALTAITTAINPTCGNGNDGSILVTVSGGTPVYTFAWSNGDNDSLANDLAAGSYIITVSDNHFCTTIATAQIYSPLGMSLSGDVGMDAANLGFINITVTGGSLPYSYLWSNGVTNANLSGLSTGDYIVTVIDANSCAVTDTFTIDIPLVIPTIITPNGDGKNDNFEIKGIGGYPVVTIEIFNRWGDVLFVFSGNGMEYTNASRRWDGKYQGNDLPMGSYVFIIKLGDQMDPITGVVSIVR